MLNLFRSLRSWLFIGWILFVVPLLARAQQDIQVISGTNPYVVIARGYQWGGSGPGNLNNNFIFHPIDPNEGFCLFLGNNNPSSSHTVSVAVSQSGDPTLTTFIGNTGQWFGVPTTTVFPVTVNPSTVVGINYKTTASATIAVQFSGASTQGGSPDTVNVFVVQTNQSACGSLAVNSVQGVVQNGNTQTNVNDFPVQIGGVSQPGSTSTVRAFTVGAAGGGFPFDGSACCASFLGNNFFTASSSAMVPNGAQGPGTQQPAILGVCPVTSFGTVSTVRVLCGYTKTNFLEIATDISSITGGSMPAWSIRGAVTNPGANALILADTLSTSATASAQYKTAVVSCSAACELQLIPITSLGTGCTVITAQNMNIWGSTRGSFATGHVAESGVGCTVQPTTTGAAMWDVQLAANTPYTIDLTGLTNVRQVTALAGWGIFNVASLTGTAIATVSLVEE